MEGLGHRWPCWLLWKADILGEEERRRGDPKVLGPSKMGSTQRGTGLGGAGPLNLRHPGKNCGCLGV